MSRYSGFSFPAGVAVLDHQTGGLVFYPLHGEPRVLRAADAEPTSLASASYSGDERAPSVVRIETGQHPPASPRPNDRGEDRQADTDPGLRRSARLRPAPMPPPTLHDGVPRPTDTQDGEDSASPGGAEPEPPGPLVRPDADDFERLVLDEYPYPIASRYLAFLNEADPRRACRRLISVARSLYQLLAFLATADVLADAKGLTGELERLLRRDLQRPSFATWLALFKASLRVLEGGGRELYCAPLSAAFDVLERRCPEPFVVETGNEPGRRLRLGKLQALVAYRDGLSSGFAFSRERAEADLAAYRPVLTEVLKACAFLTEFQLVAGLDAGPDDSPRGLPLCGYAPRREPIALAGETRPGAVVARHRTSGRQLDLLDLYVHADELGAANGLPGLVGDVACFERRVGARLVYRAVSEQSTEREAALAPLVGRIEALVRGRRRSLTAIDRETLGRAARQATDGVLRELVQSGELLDSPELARPELDDALRRFEFGRFPALALVGEPGAGQTALLAGYARARQEAGDLALLLRGATLTRPDLLRAVTASLELEPVDLAGLVAGLVPHFQAPDDEALRDTVGPRFILIVDGLDEGPCSPEALAIELEGWLAKATEQRWLRVVVGLSEAAFDALPEAVRPGRDGDARWFRVGCRREGTTHERPRVVVGPLTATRLGTFYEGYRLARMAEGTEAENEAYRPRTAFAALEPAGRAVGVLRHPLNLRLALRAYHDQALPEELTSDGVTQAYLEAVLGRGDGAAERRAMLDAVVRELDRAGTARVERARLEAVERLGSHVRNAERDSAYSQLVRAEVLAEGWAGGQCVVGVAHPALLAHVLAAQYESRIRSEADVLRLAARSVRFSSLAGALERLLMRSLATDGTPLWPGAARAGEDGEEPGAAALRGARARCLVRLARDRDPRLETALALLAGTPSAAGLVLLLEAADRLRDQGLSEERRVLEAAVSLAARIDDPGLRAAARADLAAALADDGEVEQALAELARCAEEARTDERRLGLIGLQQAQLLADLGDVERADEAAARAFERLDGRDERGTAADARLLRARLAAAAGATDQALEWLRDGLRRAREAGRVWAAAETVGSFAPATKTGAQRRALAELLEPALETLRVVGRFDWLALVMGRLGEAVAGPAPHRAEEYLRRALVLAERLERHGDVAELLGRLGVVLRRIGRAREAERSLARAIELAEGRTPQVERWRTLLSGAHLERGELAGLEVALQRAVRQAQQDDQPALEAEATRTLAQYYLARGRLAQAGDYFMRAADHALAVGDEVGRGEAENGLAIVSWRRGERDGAAARWRALAQLGEELDEQTLVGAALNGLAILAIEAGGGSAEEALATLEALAARLEHPLLALQAGARRAQLAHRRGALDEAARGWSNTRERADHLGLAPEAARARLGLALVHLDTERLGPAHDEAQEALLFFEQHEHDLDLADALVVQAVCDMLGGRLDAAEEALERQRNLAAALGYDPGLATGLRLGAEVAFERGEVEEAARRRQLHNELTEGQPRALLVRAILTLRAALATGLPEEVTQAEAEVELATERSDGLRRLDEGAGFVWRAAARYWAERGDAARSEEARRRGSEGGRLGST